MGDTIPNRLFDKVRSVVPFSELMYGLFDSEKRLVVITLCLTKDDCINLLNYYWRMGVADSYENLIEKGYKVLPVNVTLKK